MRRSGVSQSLGSKPFCNSAICPRNYFFTPRTASFAALATRNLTTVLAGILIFCRVFGLKPERAFLFCFQFAKTGQDKFAVLSDLFVRKDAERIEEYSSGSFVGLRGSGKCDLTFSFGHVLAFDWIDRKGGGR
jgi:hypothetical protein